MRTQDEIAARIKALETSGDDFFGFQREALVICLDWEHAQVFSGVLVNSTRKEWEQSVLGPNEEAVRDGALCYLEFAIGKMEDHRGISASRSVDKLRAWAWALGLDDVVSAMDSAGYTNYGAPKVHAWAVAMGLDAEEIWERVASDGVVRMARGESCSPGCDYGCGT